MAPGADATARNVDHHDFCERIDKLQFAEEAERNTFLAETKLHSKELHSLQRNLRGRLLISHGRWRLMDTMLEATTRRETAHSSQLQGEVSRLKKLVAAMEKARDSNAPPREALRAEQSVDPYS
ncbi:hypothetical protein K491DRAFT_683689 [Lophiostoma macrostomum CBS 122681]|uniref:Uncharacterized protein n=1 Tax=Lophiostoma macrostomum CBS 122681 TaxID=1314788 RepID=A0A6A6SP29_9PLEO|nr:hypothetical protein K491DRAFT_683689 [Lophiostoma macrostomum CBS 122681]